MFKKIKESLIVAASVLLFAVPVLAPVTVHAAPCDPPGSGTPAPCTDPTDTATDNSIRNNLCSGANLSTTEDSNACAKIDANDGTGAASGFNTLLTKVINIFSLIVGIVAVLMIIYGGFRYITSGGNDGSVGSAKSTILYAIIGLVIVALAQIIVRFVIAKATV